MLNKKIISIILTLTMIFSISANSLTAFAENAENQEKAEISDGTESVPDDSNDKEENTTSDVNMFGTPENEVALMSGNVSFAGGSGTEEDPYQVSTPEQLNEVRNNLDKYFIQINDIDMSEATSEGGIYWNDGKGWEPIGGYNGQSKFEGEYDGGGYSIQGLYGNISTSYSLALFYQVSKLAVICNLKIINSNLSNTYGGYCSGVAVINLGTINNCVFSGNITAAREAGGIVGCNYGIIKNSYNLGDIKSNRDAGGIASENFYGIIKNCYNNGSISGGESSGGIANYNAGEINGCYNTGNIIISGKSSASPYSAGGICAGEGNVSGVLIEGVTSKINIESCFNIGIVKTTSDESGKIGAYLGGIVGNFSNGTLQKCYNSGNFDTVYTSNYVGGIVGYVGIGYTGSRLSIYDCYNTGYWLISEEKFGGIVGELNAWSKANLYRCYSTGKSDYGCFSSYDTDVTTYGCYVLDTSCNKTSTIGTLVTEIQLRDKNTYINSDNENEKFDFDTVWDISSDINNGYPYLRNMPSLPHTHIWGEWTITKEPTQTETGTAERICGNDSSHKETATLPVLTDTTVWTKGTYSAPTCENTGSQEYISSVYGTVTETIPATGHSWGAWNITKKPTQTETGTAERICGNDSSHKGTITLPKLTDSSVWTIGAYVAPTCEGTGSQEYTSAYGTVTETIPATGHAWSAWNITKKPTQTETGTAERICGNDSSHKETATLPVLTDTTVWTKGTYSAPTCEGAGSREYVSSVYGTVTETIPATGHAWGAWNITKKPTQTETGTAERICGNDSSHKETATLPVLTDTTAWTIGAYVAPTCENAGSQEYTSAYGTVTETIPATGHAWGAWNITKKPTQTETGTAERICGNNSSHKDTATLPKLTDSSVWTIGAYVAPTCENTGSQEYISSVYGTVVEIISALGHSFNILQHDDTKHWYKCERCTAINNEENHKGGQATKTEKAVCSVCNTPYGKLLPNYVLPTDLKTTYGKTLSDIILPAGWKWTDSSIIPTVINNGYEAYYTIDNDTDYDWTKENGYDASANQIKLDLTVNVEKAEQDISYAINSINKYTTDSAFTNELTKNIVQGALSFSSSNENVAIVDNNGLVTIKGAGTAIITATVSETENYNSKSTSYTINVKRYSSHSGGGGSSTSYTISFDTNGGTQIDSVRVRRNGLLKEPESPVKAGYMFDGWYSDKELSVKYDFASKVTKSFTLYAKWHEEKSDNNHSGISDWDNPFKDVHKNDWFYDSVKYVYINGMMKGVASDLFAPDGNITRAMFITVLYRIENEPDTECDNSFNDVETNSYYEKAVYWGRKNGIVKGITNTEYAPDLNITREQMAAMIYRYMAYKNMDLSVGENTNILSYADCSNISDYAIPAMQYAIGSGIIKGMTDNTLEPQGISTRAQAATVFMRTFNLLKNTEI